MTIFWSVFVWFSPDIQPNVTLTEIIAIDSNSLKKNHIAAKSSHLWPKKMKITPKFDDFLRKFGKSRQIWAN